MPIKKQKAVRQKADGFPQKNYN